MNTVLSFDEYKILAEQAPIMVWRANLTMGCDWFNEAWFAFTGRTLEQEYGNGWAEGVHPDDFDHCLRIYTTCFPKKERFTMEYRLKNHAGEYRWILDNGSPFYHDDGTFGGFIGSCIDIHDQKLAAAALAELHERQMDKMRNLLPMCAYCRKVKTPDGTWEIVEEYLNQTHDTIVSHGMCPSCCEQEMKRFDEMEALQKR